MNRKQLVGGVSVGAMALLLGVFAAPAEAQGNGQLRGKVVDASGKPVAQAEVVFDFVGDFNRQMKTLTDKNGEWVRAGMPTGKWKITVKKHDLIGTRDATVALNQMTTVPEVVIDKPGATPAKKTTSVSPEEAEKLKKRAEMLNKLMADANAAIEAGSYDDAIAKLTALATELEKCAACYARIGEIYIKKNDLDNAEKALLKAIEIDPTQGGPYGTLATVYNQQKKFAEAEKASNKANELLGASGGGDAASVFNQGIIMWNQSKIAEAKVFFEKAIKLDPKLADAHYWYGMALVNEGKLPDAKKAFEEYLKLAPTGQYAETAKAILATIK